jgi:hypothetical protein
VSHATMRTANALCTHSRDCFLRRCQDKERPVINGERLVAACLNLVQQVPLAGRRPSPQAQW